MESGGVMGGGVNTSTCFCLTESAYTLQKYRSSDGYLFFQLVT